jgi:uncharacterized protein DUF4158
VLSPSDTAYPLLKESPTERELQELFTPNLFELGFAAENTRQPIPRLGLLLLLKSFQKLGYFVRLPEIRLLLSCTSRRPSVGTRYRTAYRPTMPAPRGPMLSQPSTSSLQKWIGVGNDRSKKDSSAALGSTHRCVNIDLERFFPEIPKASRPPLHRHITTTILAVPIDPFAPFIKRSQSRTQKNRSRSPRQRVRLKPWRLEASAKLRSIKCADACDPV